MADETPDAKPAAAPAGETFGRYLTRERELRGVSLEQIADQTRIGLSNLKALEADELGRLPERVFVLGWIKAYAKCVGMNPDEAVLRFQETAVGNAETQKMEHLRAPKKPKPFIGLVVAGAALAAALGYWLLRS